MEKKKTFYEIDQLILDCVDQETGEIFDADALESLNMERNAKIENLIKWGKSNELEIIGLKAQKKALMEDINHRIEVKENQLKGIKKTLETVLAGTKFESADKLHKVSYRKSESVEFETNFDWRNLPDIYLTEKVEFAPNKVALKSAIKDGAKIDGCYLLIKQNVQLV